MTTNTIKWKNVAIEGFEHYEVSNTGLVMTHNWKNSKQTKIMSPRNWNGYLGVYLTSDIGRARLIAVHKLVSETFIGPCPAGMECDHINSIRSDNRVENLQYLTHKENCQKKLPKNTTK